jgi:probable addiction module antidote protein
VIVRTFRTRIRTGKKWRQQARAGRKCPRAEESFLRDRTARKGMGDSMAQKSSRFDAAEHLDSDEAVAAFVNEALAAHDPARTSEALRVVARALGMSQIARQADLTHRHLFRALAEPSRHHTTTIARALRIVAVEAEREAEASHGPWRVL